MVHILTRPNDVKPCHFWSCLFKDRQRGPLSVRTSHAVALQDKGSAGLPRPQRGTLMRGLGRCVRPLSSKVFTRPWIRGAADGSPAHRAIEERPPRRYNLGLRNCALVYVLLATSSLNLGQATESPSPPRGPAAWLRKARTPRDRPTRHYAGALAEASSGV
jgi:hypothetical protein